jgi:hypothetical protein
MNVKLTNGVVDLKTLWDVKQSVGPDALLQMATVLTVDIIDMQQM